MARPIEARPRVALAIRRDVSVSDRLRQGIPCLQRARQARQLEVLRGFVGDRVAALELDADREIVTALTLPENRLAGMPGALAEWHELQHFTITADQQVCRYLETLQSHISPLAREYFAILREAFSDINDYVDEKLDSELATIIAIAIIIATPIAGIMIFFAVLGPH